MGGADEGSIVQSVEGGVCAADALAAPVGGFGAVEEARRGVDVLVSGFQGADDLGPVSAGELEVVGHQDVVDGVDDCPEVVGVGAPSFKAGCGFSFSASFVM